MPCPNPVPMVWAETRPGLWRTQRPLTGTADVPCKRWACEHCGKGKRAEALKLIRAVARTGIKNYPRQPLRFITLTRPRDKPNHLGDREDCAGASADVRELVRAWRRSRGGGPGHDLEYVRVLERTKRGRIHVHLLTWGHYVAKCTDKGRRSRGLPTGRGSGSPCYCTPARPCIQRLAWAHGWGYVDVRAVRSPRAAAAYIAKYLGKQSTDDWPRHARRLSYSRRASGGLTLAAVHAAWVAEVTARLGGPDPWPRVWRAVPVARVLPLDRAPPLPHPLGPMTGRISNVTGRSIPTPF